MPSAKGYLGRKAVKATARHTVRGTVSKARRDPPRAATLLGVGTLIGLVIGLALSRVRGSRSEDEAFSAPPPAPATAPTPAAVAA